jgi:hypothetical protein
VTAALAELELELELSSWAPWRLLERGNEWILDTRAGRLFIPDDLLSQGLIYCDPSRELNFLAADAIGFACFDLSVLH